uniref:Macaca fascicularis brain cDNA clone: QtrA-17532, similar to human cadherin 9, type 2 (T1-cadherin) (CDH9), mRNA, RefSeq: NM_016279.2 n=1 Tax=Macaca fascicularis TaxID=9541 RepID=I7GM33_MACFA|nr:unnamed protein product [Macaca fascicularis]
MTLTWGKMQRWSIELLKEMAQICSMSSLTRIHRKGL